MEEVYKCRGRLLCVTTHSLPMENGLCANCGGYKVLYKILDKMGDEMPEHYSGRERTFDEAKKMIDRLNKDGEFKPYTMIQV